MRSLRHRIGHHAVDADRRQRQRDRRKYAEQKHIETTLRDRIVHPLLHRVNVVHRLIFVYGQDLPAHGADQTRRIARCAYNQGHVPRCEVREWAIHLGPGVGVQGGVVDILHYAYDLTPHRHTIATPIKSQPLADRVLLWKETADKGLVDDERPGSVAPITIGEGAARQQWDAHGLEIIRADLTCSGMERFTERSRPPLNAEAATSFAPA